MTKTTLGIGFVGAGFMNRFHVASPRRRPRLRTSPASSAPHARHADALAATAPTSASVNRRSTARSQSSSPIPTSTRCGSPRPTTARRRRRGDRRRVRSGKGELVGWPREAARPQPRRRRRMLELVESTPLLHGYLENQVFQPSIVRGKEIIWRRAVPIAGRPYLARAAEEHSGPHMPWFWSGERQGGGVLNDMLCHSYEAARFLLAAPGEPREALVVEDVNAQIASLEVDAAGVRRAAARDVGRRRRLRAARRRRTSRARLCRCGRRAARRCSSRRRRRGASSGPRSACARSCWAPSTRCRSIASRRPHRLPGPQNPGRGRRRPRRKTERRTGTDARHRRRGVGLRLHRREPPHGAGVPRRPHADENWRDGVAVTEVLMACYKSAEDGATMEFPAKLDDFVPAVASGRLAG